MAASTRRCCLLNGAVRLRTSVPCISPAPLRCDATRSLRTDRGAVPQSIPFWKLVENRQSEASRSVVFSIANQEQCQDAVRACQAHGDVSRCFYYNSTPKLPSTTQAAGAKHFALVEFGNVQFLQSFMHCVQPLPSEALRVPTRTRMVFVAGGSSMQANRAQVGASTGQPYAVDEETPKSTSALDLLSYESIGDQIVAIYENQQQNELNARLRFYVCSVLEEALCGSFLPRAQIRPFGWSLSGLGRLDCDLEMSLILDGTGCKPPSTRDQGGKLTFRFITKSFGSGRDVHVGDQILRAVSNMITYCIPQMHKVAKATTAWAPAINFHHGLSNFDCQLSISDYRTTNGSPGMAATEMLYILGEADARFRPLNFALQHWAQENHLARVTSNSSSHLTNFQLALLVVHFLQTKKVLPEVEALVVPPEPGNEWKFWPGYGQNYSFLSDYSKLPVSRNQQTIGELFEEFFQYYAAFDFSKHAVSVLTHSLPPKADGTPLNIVNPQEPKENLSNNVDGKELERFRRLMRKSADTLRSTRTPSLSSVLSLSHGR